MTHNSNIQTGNAGNYDKRGWFVGHFMEPENGLLHNKDVEVKWGVQARGDGRDEWSTDPRETLNVLVSGKVEIIFRNRTITLNQPGDFVIWKSEDHKSEILDDSVILTIRWPSV